MGNHRSSRVTKQDIAKAEDIPAFIKEIVKRIVTGDHEARENSAVALKHMALQNHGEHAVELFRCGAIPALVSVVKDGSANAQTAASAALAAIANGKPDHQDAVVKAGGVIPLVALLKTGSCMVQEQVWGSPRPLEPCCPRATCLNASANRFHALPQRRERTLGGLTQPPLWPPPPSAFTKGSL